MSRGDCGIVCTVGRTLRFVCFASLLAVIFLVIFSVGSATWGGPGADMEVSEPPTPVDRPALVATEKRGEVEPCGNRSSGTIMITMTGAVGDPGDLGG